MGEAVEPSTIIILAAIFLFASFIQGLTGFAFGLLSVSLFTILFSTREAVAIVAISGSILMSYSFFLHRKSVEYRKVFCLSMMSVVFIPLGAAFLVKLPETIVMASLGGIIVLIAVYSSLFADRSRKLMSRKGSGFIAAMISGLLGGAFTSPGPAMIVYLYTLDESRMQAKANVQFYFIIVSVVIVISHIVSGTIDSTACIRSLPFIPIIFLGTKIGVLLSKKLPVAVFKTITDIALVVLGAYILLSSLVS